MAFNINRQRLKKAIYAPILATAMALMLGRFLLFAKILDLNAFAELSAVYLVSGIVGMLSSFGMFLDLQRKLPGYLALGQRRAAATIIWQSLLGTVAIGIVGVAFASAGLSFGSISSTAVLLGVMHGVVQQAFLIQTTESRSSNDPLRFSMQSIARALGILLFAVPISIEFGTALSVVIPECFVTGVMAISISHNTAKKMSLSHRRAALLGVRSFRRMRWGSTLSLLLLSLAVTTSSSMDRWLSSLTLQPADFAEYSFASITMTAAFALQGLINASVFPMIAKRSAIHGVRSAYRLALLSAFGTLGIFLVAIVPAIYVAEFLILQLYPKYSDAIPLIPILAIAAAFRISDFWSSFLVIRDREKTSLLINMVAAGTAFVIWLLTRFGARTPEAGIAYMAAFVAASTYVISFIFSHIHFRSSNAEITVAT
ncbi:hypothetical protein J5277_11970 [Rhizobium sp. 16-449-1b]|uniref:hypothetical protein n=1 Tax=Rhizobium sp. 16-449-1b TaxID=2819989 RepID=UPI001ADD0DB0|nr:hypothetical protein [Rhizobium sp. 16-449-1b]MBO9194825.1 hypothetical protein [Rhizobium sp. 16-449-1b]